MDNKREIIKVIAEKEICGKPFRVWGTPEKPLFLAKDVAQWLGHEGSQSAKDMCRYIDEDKKVKCNILSPYKDTYRKRANWFITEQGLYKTIMRSDKPNAVQFQDKVCEILKEIRQTGGYIANSHDMTDDELLMKALELAQRKINSRVNQIEC